MKTLSNIFYVLTLSFLITACGGEEKSSNSNKSGDQNAAGQAGGNKLVKKDFAVKFACPKDNAKLVVGMNQNWKSGDKVREFHIDAPKNPTKKKLAVIFSWHGVGDNINNWRFFFAPT